MDLIQAIKNHLESCSTSEDYNEIQQDSFSAAVDCLENALEECETEPIVDLNLGDLWAKIQERKKKTMKKPVAETKEPASQQKTWPEFLEMIKNQKEGLFFKGVATGGEEYVNRLKIAKQKYLTHFPNGNVPELDLPAAEQDKTEAEALKKKGNQLLQGGNAKEALEAYSQAIMKNRHNAIFFANRSFCNCRLENFDDAILDANEAIRLDPSYTKAYNRLATAQKQAGNIDEAIDAFEKVIEMSPAGSASKSHCQKQIAELNRQRNPPAEQGMPDLSGLGGLGNLLGGLGGGMGGPGGMDIASLLKNPAMRQMAEQMMQDPNAMSQMQGMMSNPAFMQNMSSAMGGNGGDMGNLGNLMGQMGQQDPDMLAKLSQLATNPEKKAEVMEKVMQDPDIQKYKNDPEVGPVLERLKAQDMSAMTELMGKPQVFAELQQILGRYL